MSNWLANAIAEGQSKSDWLSIKRKNSLELLRHEHWPTRKTEAWKYTPVKPVDRAMLSGVRYSLDTDVGNEAAGDAVNNSALDSHLSGVIAGSIDIKFVNGLLQEKELPKNLPSGLTISSVASLAVQERDWVVNSFAAIKPNRHLFGLVNDVKAVDVVIIDVADNAVIDQPIHVSNVYSHGCEAHTRLLVRLGAAAKATIVEHYQGNELSLNTGFAEYELGEHAHLEHYRFALQTGSAVSVGGCHFQLAGKADLNTTLIGFGSDLSRVDVDIMHRGEHATAKMNALYLLDGDELFDLHSTIEHEVAFGTTEENVRGIAAGQARAVFNGRIHIHRGAQKTLAELHNRNLLLSKKAQVNTKPELEIYADDVRCAHGATISQIDSNSLYYMQSRGISRVQAQILLSFGFINELVDQMPCQQLAQWLRPILRERFAQMDVN